MFNHLRIEVSPSPESNDHQARILIDGEDWLWRAGAIGLDPPDLLKELAKQQGPITVGRCTCGCLGCGDVEVDVQRHGTHVEWIATGGALLQFGAAQYDQEVVRFRDDHSWETLGRRVEREVGDVFSGCRTAKGLIFEWASTRIKEGLIHLSFTRSGIQDLRNFAWDGKSIESALNQARILRTRWFGGR